jgi:hypothetical protein
MHPTRRRRLNAVFGEFKLEYPLSPRFQVLAMASIKTAVLSDVAPCSLVHETAEHNSPLHCHVTSDSKDEYTVQDREASA